MIGQSNSNETNTVEEQGTIVLTVTINSSSDSTGRPDLALILVGGPELLLDLPDRFGRPPRCAMRPRSLHRGRVYRLCSRPARVAANARAQLFTQDALAMLHHAADGLPRRLNRLVDLALLIAYAQEIAIVDEAIAQAAARDFHRDAA